MITKQKATELIIDLIHSCHRCTLDIERVVDRIFKEDICKTNAPLKPTDTNIAKYYELSRQTIASYRVKKVKLYQAMVKYFLEETK